MASRGLNKVHLIGNLGREPDMRYTESGKATTRVSLAVNQFRRDANGERVEHVEWFLIVIWDKLAETAGQYLTKGAKVYVEGRLQTRRYVDKTGVERTAIEVVASDLIMLDSRAAEREPVAVSARSAGAAASSGEPPSANASRSAPVADEDDLDNGDDIPF